MGIRLPRKNYTSVLAHQPMWNVEEEEEEGEVASHPKIVVVVVATNCDSKSAQLSPQHKIARSPSVSSP